MDKVSIEEMPEYEDIEIVETLEYDEIQLIDRSIAEVKTMNLASWSEYAKQLEIVLSWNFAFPNGHIPFWEQS